MSRIDPVLLTLDENELVSAVPHFLLFRGTNVDKVFAGRLQANGIRQKCR